MPLRTYLLSAALLFVAPLAAQTASDGRLVTVEYSAKTDSTTLSATAEFRSSDTTNRSISVLSLHTVFPGNGLSGTPAPVDIALWYSNVAPTKDATHLTFSVDGAPQTPLPTESTCAFSPAAYNAEAFGAVLPPEALHHLAEAKRLELTIGTAGFYATEDGLAILRAFAARVPAVADSTARAAAENGSSRSMPMFRYQVETPVQAQRGNPAPHAPGGHGEVLVQFVVDTSGLAVMSTFKVLRSTGQAYTDAVRAVLPSWRFEPAQACGRNVREYVQMPVIFGTAR